MRDFYTAIWPTHGFGELRTFSIRESVDNVGVIHPDQAFVNLANPDGIEEAVRLAAYFDAIGRDVYFGVLPRVRLSGKAQDAWPETSVLWADVDAKRFEDGLRGSLQAILDFPLPASVIVDSGHGHHAYWKLQAAVPFPEARLAMQGIAKAINGDAVYDASRVLRVPGTHNHKVTGEVEPVRLLRLDQTRTLRFTDFADQVEAATPPAPDFFNPVPGWSIQQAGDRTPMSALPAWLQTLIGGGAPVGSRSEKSFAAVCGLLKANYDDADIAIVFRNSPIGEKMREKGDERGMTWLQKTINKARGALVA